ncbi:hypothetical protein [Vibrio sp. 10N.261.52.A1]|uniref:hypothetical protein n=1 Tax=Vibrio TaxID=662 RepID=UPI000C829A6E|nr:hypothetical protein [Vibrio sp. 10N.261.52.A1]PML54701.1 hypothetical protein BCT81_01295 [Vibrio sp. 10N.261.52.A1]
MLIKYKNYSDLDDSTLEHMDKLKCSELFHQLKIQFEPMCGSTYCFGDIFNTQINQTEIVEHNWMVSIPIQNQLFTLDSVRESVPENEKGINVRCFLDQNLYELIFFVDPRNPKELIGFCSLSKFEHNDDGYYSIRIVLEMIYVKPKFRNGIRGQIMAYETGRLISSQKVFDEFNNEYRYVDVEVAGQGTNAGGRACLERFYLGINFHLGGISIEDKDGCDIEIPSNVILCDEY